MRGKLKRRCQLWWCDAKHYANGFCEKHNASLSRNGTPVSPKQPHLTVLLNMIDKMRYLLIHHGDTSVPEVEHVLHKTENQHRLLVSQIGDCPVCEVGYRARISGADLIVECDCSTVELEIIELIDVLV